MTFEGGSQQLIALLCVVVAVQAGVGVLFYFLYQRGQHPWQLYRRWMNRLPPGAVPSITHEIRTPLVTVQYALSILSDQAEGKLTESEKHFLFLAHRNLDRLSELINGLVASMQREAGGDGKKRS